MANDPQIGELIDRSTLKRWQDVPDGGFGVEQTFDEGREIWAKLTPVGTAIFLGAMQLGEGVTHQMLARYSPDINERTVTADHVVECDGLRYRVKRSCKFKGMKVFLFVELELLGDIAAL